MSESETRSLIRFLVLYLSSTFALFSVASWIFYHATERNIYRQQRATLQTEADHIRTQLRTLHLSDAPILRYPNNPTIHSAIYDRDGNYIFGSFPVPPRPDAAPPEGMLQLRVAVEPYYLGAAQLLLRRSFDDAPLYALRRNIVLYMVGGGVLFALLGYMLGRLFIAPMRESVEQMNRFIEDTAHEMNTPVSTILANIEMIEALNKGADVRQELERIEIASRTLSRMYDDLSYLSLNHPYHRRITDVDLSTLVAERCDYFAIVAEARQLRTKRHITSGIHLAIDPNDAIRLIDNLLSNAIKYNRTGGMLRVTLRPDGLTVSDTGIGIPADRIATIHERFRRANTSEGGFGIGLNIVHQVVRHYGFTFAVDSEVDRGTDVQIGWGSTHLLGPDLPKKEP